MIDFWWNDSMAREPELDDLPPTSRLALLEEVNAMMLSDDPIVYALVLGYLVCVASAIAYLYVHPIKAHELSIFVIYPLVFIPLVAHLWRVARMKKVTRRLQQQYRHRSIRAEIAQRLV